MINQYNLHIPANTPAHGRGRTRVLCKFSHAELCALRDAHKISQDDYAAAVFGRRHGKSLLDIAVLLGVRGVDINRWDTDQRLPHSYKERVHHDGKTALTRVWIPDDIDYAALHTRKWLMSDIQHNIIQMSPSVQLMLEHLESLPSNYTPSGARSRGVAFMDRLTRASENLRVAYRRERDEQKELENAQKAQDRLDTEKRIASILSMAGDRHWDTIFHNPQIGTRQMDAYLGPTNSGKTHTALQAILNLKHGETGVYLAPLRLLALEVCEELRSHGVAASLITGEEQDIDPDAGVICSTIEMLDATQYYNVAIIDEAQLITDGQRGWAWTRALFQLDAEHIFVLGSPAVERLLTDFAVSTGDHLSIHHTTRFTPLDVHPRPIPPEQLEKGTIFSVFSRNSVIQWGQYFRNNGHTVAQIYGAMPPEVRREEARRFRSGEADILVATDAVAMGLNLPAHTVVIGEYEKYDGESTAPVSKVLVRQIAGRAGRFGFHDAGCAAGTDVIIHKHVQAALKSQDASVTFPMPVIAPTPDWVDMVLEVAPETSVRDLLVAWEQTIAGSKWFTCIDMTMFLEKARVLDSVDGVHGIPMHERLQILTAPVNLRTGQLENFRAMIRGIVQNTPIPSPITPTGSTVITDDLESVYKAISLYCWFHYRYPHIFTDIERAETERTVCVDRLIDHIRKGLKRYCRSCGAPITAAKNVSMCRNCYTAYQHRMGNAY